MQPVALRPAGWPAHTSALFHTAEPPVTDVEGAEASARLDALFPSEPLP